MEKMAVKSHCLNDKVMEENN